MDYSPDKYLDRNDKKSETKTLHTTALMFRGFTISAICGLLSCIGVGCHHAQPSPSTSAPVRSLPYYNSADFTPHWKEDAGFNPDTIHRIPAFAFTDQEGNRITEATIHDKIFVADFFFTSCGGICPKLTNNLKMVQDSFINDPGIVLLSHSVTPDKDDVAALKKYAVNHDVSSSKWHLLTGNKDSIYTIARKYYFADEDLGLQRNSNDFLHTENMLLLDKNRRIRGIYKGTSVAEIQNLVADIRSLQKETP